MPGFIVSVSFSFNEFCLKKKKNKKNNGGKTGEIIMSVVFRADEPTRI